MKSILLTRSVEDNHNIIKFLDNKAEIVGKKLKYICSPLVEYKVLDFNFGLLEEYNNIIITSKFATKLFVACFNKYSCLEKCNYIKKNIWVVGESSNIILLQNDFKAIKVARNVQELMENLPPEFYKQSIYLSSNEITQDLPLEITRQIIYQVKYAQKLHHLEEIKQGVDYILVYSQNSAKTLIRLLKDNNLLGLLSVTQVIAISEKVGAIVKDFTKNVIYCNKSSSKQMLKLLLIACGI